MRDFDLTTLRLFVSVCETGNIARAGEKASIVGSAISKRLTQLEEQVGTALLVRKRHGVVPTAAGQTLLEHARGMLDGAARIERDMRAYVAGGLGQVRMFASATAMTESLADDVASFLRRPAHKAIRVDLEERVSPEIVRGVREGLASIGVCWDAADAAGLQTRAYRRDTLCVAVPARHPLAGRKSLRFEQTLDFEHVSLPVNSTLQLVLRWHAAQLGRSVNQRVIVSNFDAAVRVVGAELAISLVPREVVPPGLDSRRVRLIPLAEDWAERRFILCFRDPQLLTPAARMLLDHLGSLDSPPAA